MIPTTLTRARRAVAAGLAVLALPAAWSVAAPTAASADTAVASDGFDRSTGSGWGTAPTGGTWSVVGGSSSSTGSSAAKVTGVAGGRSMRASLPITISDTVVRAAFVVPSSGEFYYATEGRRQSDGSAYRASARIDSAHRLSVQVVRYTGGSERVLNVRSTGTSVSAGQQVSVELSVAGTSPVSVKAKTYLSGTKAPDWQAVASDSDSARITRSGAVGVWGYNVGGNPSTTVSTSGFSAWTSSGTTTPTTPTATEPTPTPTPAPAPTTSTSHGSVPVGSASYAVPSGAVFVSPSGNDSAAGTLSSPLKTVTKALSKVQAGGAVVLRGGTYHEYVIVPPGKNVPIQNYPKEAVWFDGSSPVSGFSQSGSAWVKTGWTTTFDSSPTYTKGAPDGTAAGWQFLNSSYPLAAHPDAVWIDGVEQTQVGSVSALKAGTFYVDYSASKLYLGSNPSGRSVAASTLQQAVSLRAPGTVLRGIGFRRYADSVWQQGVITSYYPSMTLENVVVADAATAGIGLYGTGSTLRNVTVTGAGQMGVQASRADGLVLDNVSIRNSNDQNFNPTPSAGGFKVTITRGVTLRNSEIVGTNGNQFWTDQSTYDITAVGNDITGGTRWGVVLEISSTATIADNVIANNAFDGIVISDTDKVNVWNNTIVGNKRAALRIVQDTRRIEQLSVSGHDPRRTQPDLSMPWVVRNTVVGNNILTGGATDTSEPILRVQSWERAFAANEMLASSNGNVFGQTKAGAPTYVTIWGRKDAWPVNYTTLADYAAGTGYDRSSLSLIGTSPVSSTYGPSSTVEAKTSTVAQALPSSIAAKTGKASGSKHLGAWR